ncbi:type II toxin-antitoxin system RelE/ParE family toxin [bacterium]|nr:type II toxin-antitoxin system RelE/ParE family toxin [bacterium]
MATLKWTLEAIERLKEIHEYIARDSPSAADSVIDGIFERTQLLRTHPRIGQRYEAVVDREVREILFGSFRIPYLVVDDANIEILGVFHGAMEIERYLEDL